MITTGKAIRNFCKECVNSNRLEAIKNCGGEFVLATKKPCALFNYRLRRGNLKAIRKNCKECQGGDLEAVRECTTTTCPLFPFRTGVGNRKRSPYIMQF